jgi:hypothetical protein
MVIKVIGLNALLYRGEMLTKVRQFREISAKLNSDLRQVSIFENHIFRSKSFRTMFHPRFKKNPWLGAHL